MIHINLHHPSSLTMHHQPFTVEGKAGNPARYCRMQLESAEAVLAHTDAAEVAVGSKLDVTSTEGLDSTAKCLAQSPIMSNPHEPTFENQCAKNIKHIQQVLSLAECRGLRTPTLKGHKRTPEVQHGSCKIKSCSETTSLRHKIHRKRNSRSCLFWEGAIKKKTYNLNMIYLLYV